MTIQSPKLEKLAQRLASLTGEDVATAVERAVEERLSRVKPPVSAEERRAALQEFFDRVSALPDLDPRPHEEIIGYDENGLPT
jgi:antitoxin VapB